MSRLKCKRAVVTGAGQGLGRAIAAELLQQGCHVALHYRASAAGAQEVQGSAPVGVRCECFAADLTDEQQASDMVLLPSPSSVGSTS